MPVLPNELMRVSDFCDAAIVDIRDWGISIHGGVEEMGILQNNRDMLVKVTSVDICELRQSKLDEFSSGFYRRCGRAPRRWIR